MERFWVVTISAPQKRGSAFDRVVADWSKRGYVFQDRPTRVIPSRRLLVSPVDRRWKREADSAVKAGALDSWTIDYVETVYSQQDIASAEVFRVIHTGRCINFKTGKDHIARVSDIADWETSGACPRCGAGVRQISPLRLLGSELNKAGRFASIWLGSNTFWMVSAGLRREIERGCGEKLPVREVELTGKTRSKERWWQLAPSWAPRPSDVKISGYRRLICSKCRAVSCGAPAAVLVLQPYSLAARTFPKRTPPFFWDSVWGGSLDLSPDGRVGSAPERGLWLRGDVARVLRSARIPGLDLTPVLRE
jgi:hypothetical protein